MIHKWRVTSTVPVNLSDPVVDGGAVPDGFRFGICCPLLCVVFWCGRRSSATWEQWGEEGIYGERSRKGEGDEQKDLMFETPRLRHFLLLLVVHQSSCRSGACLSECDFKKGSECKGANDPQRMKRNPYFGWSLQAATWTTNISWHEQRSRLIRLMRLDSQSMSKFGEMFQCKIGDSLSTDLVADVNRSKAY